MIRNGTVLCLRSLYPPVKASRSHLYRSFLMCLYGAITQNHSLGFSGGGFKKIYFSFFGKTDVQRKAGTKRKLLLWLVHFPLATTFGGHSIQSQELLPVFHVGTENQGLGPASSASQVTSSELHEKWCSWDWNRHPCGIMDLVTRSSHQPPLRGILHFSPESQFVVDKTFSCLFERQR